MKADQKRVSALLVQTVSLLCKNGLLFDKSLHIQGLLAITVDEKDVFIVQLDDTLWPKELEDVHDSDQSSKTNLSPMKDANLLNHHSIEIAPLDQQTTTPVNVEASVNNYPSNVDLTPDEVSETQNEEDRKDNDEIIFVKTEDKKENEDLDEISCTDQDPNIFNNEIIQMNQNNQNFNDNQNYQMNNVDNTSHKQANEGGKKRRMQRRADDNFNMAPIENLENSLVPSYDNFNGFKNDLTADLVKESWTYTKYRHTSKHSPKNAQQDYSSHSDNYQDNNSLILFNNSRNDNQFNINNNSSPTEQQFQANNNTSLPRRRSNMKTVVCQYPDCGKTFCHSCHLYRHQRLKHGHRFGVVTQVSFACQHPKCGKVFYRRSSLINHCLHVHSSSAEPFNAHPSQYSFPAHSSDHGHDVDNILLDCHDNSAGHLDDDQYNDVSDEIAMATSHGNNDGASGSVAFLSDHKPQLKEQLFTG